MLLGYFSRKSRYASMQGHQLSLGSASISLTLWQGIGAQFGLLPSRASSSHSIDTQFCLLPIAACSDRLLGFSFLPVCSPLYCFAEAHNCLSATQRVWGRVRTRLVPPHDQTGGRTHRMIRLRHRTSWESPKAFEGPSVAICLTIKFSPQTSSQTLQSVVAFLQL